MQKKIACIFMQENKIIVFLFESFGSKEQTERILKKKKKNRNNSFLPMLTGNFSIKYN